MPKLSSAQRKQIPAAAFGLPAQRKYPMPDPSHAANAKARAAQQYKRGGLSLSQLGKIDAKANRKLA